MAHFWARGANGWIARLLYAGSPAGPVVLPVLSAPVAPVLVSAGNPSEGTAVWALLASRGTRVFVNGVLVRAGICALSDRDQILVGDNSKFFFCTESPAVVVPFPDLGGAVYCARCREGIAPGTPAVACPGAGCGLWYHHDPDAGLPCFTYASKCTFCPAPTSLDRAFSWSPEEEAE